MNPSPTFPASRPTGVRWGVFALACSTSWLLYLHRYTFALIKPDLQQEWDLGEGDLGLLDSAFSLPYTLFQIPLGVAADFLGVHLVLTVLILVWSLGLALHGLAPNVTILAAARAALGTGQSAGYACLNRVSRTWFPAGVRTSLQGWVGVTFGRLGGVSAYLILGWLLLGVLDWSWRPALYLFAAAGIVQGVLFAGFFRNDPRVHPLVNDAEGALIAGTGAAVEGSAVRPLPVRDMLRRTNGRSLVNLVALNVQTILSTAADNIYSNWMPLFLVSVYHFEKERMGLYSSVPLIGGAIGGAVGGWLNDWLIRSTGNLRWARSLMGFASKGGAAVILLCGLAVIDHPYLFCGVLFFVKLWSDSGLATTWGAVTDIGGRQTASVFAFNNAVAGIGSVAAPVVFGYMIEHYGWGPVFASAAGCYALCGLSWLLINCRIPVVDESQDVNQE